MRKFSLVAAVAVLAALPGLAHAQAALYDSSPYDYALLNGSNIALYVDALGDLGAPVQAGTPAKPGGILNSSGQVEVNADGSVTSGAGTYAALYSSTSTASLSSLQAQVQAKNEYLSLGNAATLEGYSIHVGSGSSFVPYTSMSNSSFSVSGNSNTGQLTATSNNVYNQGGVNLGISQTINFNQGSTNIAQFTVTFTNQGTSAISGLQYVRAVNPNQDMGPGGSNSVGTSQSFGTSGDTTAFALNSTGATSGRQIAIGVHPTDANSPGTAIYAVNGSIPATTLLTNPSYLTTYNTVNYMQLNSTANSDGTYGATYVDRNITHQTYTSNNYQGYIAGNAADAFTYGSLTATPQFTSYADTTLVLMSPVLPTLNAGQSTSFTFYYIFPASSVPEPGMLSLLGCIGLSGLALRMRRRRA